MKPPFLTGEHVYIRAMLATDKDCASAWFDSVFPVNAERAEDFLRENVQDRWGEAKRERYVIARSSNDEVIGGIITDTLDYRTTTLTFRMAPHLSPSDADEFKASALRLVVPWLRDEYEYMAQSIPIAADESACLAAADELDLVLGVQFRGYLARSGQRVDLLLYQALNPRWELPDA